MWGMEPRRGCLSSETHYLLRKLNLGRNLEGCSQTNWVNTSVREWWPQKTHCGSIRIKIRSY